MINFRSDILTSGAKRNLAAPLQQEAFPKLLDKSFLHRFTHYYKYSKIIEFICNTNMLQGFSCRITRTFGHFKSDYPNVIAGYSDKNYSGKTFNMLIYIVNS